MIDSLLDFLQQVIEPVLCVSLHHLQSNVENPVSGGHDTAENEVIQRGKPHARNSVFPAKIQPPGEFPRCNLQSPFPNTPLLQHVNMYSRCDLYVSLIPLMQTQSHDGEIWR